MSDRFADRVRRAAGADVERQVQHVFSLALGRSASREEIDLAAPLVRNHGLAAFCRVVFNSNEFLYVD